MLKNSFKLDINKKFLFCIGVFCLIFMAFGLTMEGSFAAEINNDTYELGVDTNIDNKIINSQDHEILEVNSQSDVLTENERTPGGYTFKDIKNCIDGASEGDIILLSGNYYASDNQSQVNINKRVTITSKEGAVLDGKEMSGIFRVTSDGVIISNLKFINGKHMVGAAIRDQAKNLTVENCVFENNHGDGGGGGAIATSYTPYTAENLKVINCNFTNNHDHRDDFSNNSAAGAVGAYSRGAQIINCIFDSNWIKGELESYGGALQIGMDVPDNYGLVDRCIFKNNQVIVPGGNSHGGAGCVRNGVNYTNCLFINNSAGQGGALTFHASGSIFNCTFINNTAEQYGGAISSGYSYDSMILNIIDCDFVGNQAPDGGAIQALGLNINLIDSYFDDNHATNCGGAVNIIAENVNVDNSNFVDNTADVDGGAIYINGVNTKVIESSFISNHAFPDVDKLNDGLGGAIYVNSTQTTIVDNTFEFNTARNGSAIYYDSFGENLVLMDNVLFENQAWVYHLPIFTNNISYGDSEKIKVVLHGGNNIGKYGNLAISNAIYNAADFDKIEIDSETPIFGASNDGRLYQDDREYNMQIWLTVTHEDGTVVYNESSNSSYLGEINVDLNNLDPGKYFVSAKHIEDTYYKGITNVSSFSVYPKVDNRITIKTSDYSFDFEDVVVWTINVTNLGPNNSTGVIAYNVIPEGLILVNHTFGDKYNPKTGELNIGDLDVGENLVYSAVTVVNKTGYISNSVNVTANEEDIDMSNNFDEEEIYISPAIDLAVVKVASSNAPNYNDDIVWTITVTNNGPDTAHDVIVVDLLPDSLIFVESDGDYDANTGIWNVGTLDGGKSCVLTIQCIVDKSGLTQNNVSVNGSEFDYDLSNNHDEELIFVNPSSDLAITKTVNATDVNYMDTVKWTLEIINYGPDTAKNVKVNEVLPEGFIFINSNMDYVNNTFTIESMDIGEVIVIELTTRVNLTGNFVNIANVTSDSYDDDLTNNEDQEAIDVNAACDLVVLKEVSESSPSVHDNVTWTITVKNCGPDVAHNIVVKDLLPDSLVWIGDDTFSRYNPLTGELNIDNLEAGDEFSFNIVCMVNGTGLIQNIVTVNCREYDSNLTNNEANETIDVESSSDVSIVKLVSNKNPYNGEIVTWTLIISNKGPDKATDVYIEDILPEGLILINYTATKGFYDGAWVMCCLENGEEQRLELITKVNKTGNITNLATISSEGYDPNPDDNQDNESISVSPACDLSISKTASEYNYAPGDVIEYVIEIVNNGPDVAYNIKSSEFLDDFLELKSVEVSMGEFDNDTLIWSIDSLGHGESSKLYIEAIAIDVGLLRNYVSVMSDTLDSNLDNNFDEAVVNVSEKTDDDSSKDKDPSDGDGSSKDDDSSKDKGSSDGDGSSKDDDSSKDKGSSDGDGSSKDGGKSSRDDGSSKDKGSSDGDGLSNGDGKSSRGDGSSSNNGLLGGDNSFGDDSSAKSGLGMSSSNVLEKHVTSNPFFTLVLVLVISLIFFDGNISKKR